jgi:hypothetical protein
MAISLMRSVTYRRSTPMHTSSNIDFFPDASFGLARASGQGALFI